MNLKQKLEYHYKVFDKTKLEPDPLQFLHLFKAEEDIEIVGFELLSVANLKYLTKPKIYLESSGFQDHSLLIKLQKYY